VNKVGNWIHLDESIKGRINAVKKENERIINLLIQLKVIRENITIPGWYVIYTEDGPKDIDLKNLGPCIKFYATAINQICGCRECSKEKNNE
jgi:hypothetical protein